MIKYKPLPPLERLNELFEVVEIPPDKYGKWSGLIRKIGRPGGGKAGSVAGGLVPAPTNPDRVHWKVRVDDSAYFVSRIIYYMTYGTDPVGVQVDHKDQNWLNNNTWNLRIDVERDTQQINRPMQKNNTSGVVGVTWSKTLGKWSARVKFNKKEKHLGYFTCKIEAARVVRDKWVELEWHKKGRKLPNFNEIECDCGVCRK